MKEKLSIILASIAEILVGILLLVDPIGLTIWIVRALGVVFVVAGVISVIQYFRQPAVEALLKKSLAAGILAVIFGLWCITQGEWFLSIFPLLTTLYGIAILVSGAVKIQWTTDMIRLKRGPWIWMALSAAVTMICSFVILANPFASAAALWIFIGITMIVEAVIDIVAAFFKK